MDPTIAADLNHEHEPRNYFNATNQIDITIHHLPQNIKVESQKSSPFFSVAQLIESTANVTRYLASLGHNVNIYKEPESTTDQLYILYDAVEIKDAYEVSTAALVTVGVLTLLFGLTFAISESFKTVYNSSIYKTIYKELSTKNEAMPMLMHHTRDPLAFDGNQVLHRSDDLHDGTLGSQDHPMVSLQRRSNVPGNQQERRSVDLPDESTVRCQRRNTCSTTKSTPAVNPATITSTTTTTSSTGPSQDTQVQPHENPNLSVPSAYSR
ncbi:hypothetical protein BGW42_006162 [Actinomortierella wolfii]|nr:hypothetical protein BGW42_006162 [Actinomortierella wolfii]